MKNRRSFEMPESERTALAPGDRVDTMRRPLSERLLASDFNHARATFYDPQLTKPEAGYRAVALVFDRFLTNHDQIACAVRPLAVGLPGFRPNFPTSSSWKPVETALRI